MSAAQLRAARGLLGWSQQELADAAGIGRATIADFESARREPYAQTIEDLKKPSRRKVLNLRTGLIRVYAYEIAELE